MSLDVCLHQMMPTEVFSYNITHNLGKMAEAAGIYDYLWRPEGIEITIAEHLIAPLTEGLEKLKSNKDYYSQFNPDNGWGTYDHFVSFVEAYLDACKKYPDSKVSVWR